jgi:anaerobic ribonucleoside-triphosphate reductase activating protein
MSTIKVNYIGKKLHAQGPGTRYTIWTQGCSIHCPGCSNKDTWDFNKGTEYDIKVLAEDILSTNGIDGVTITGGEPLDQFDAVYELCHCIFKEKSIFLTTGYSTLNLERAKIITVLDMLCCGPFELDKKCNDGWRGSSNQDVVYLTERGKKQDKLFPFVSKEFVIAPDGQTIKTGFHL